MKSRVYVILTIFFTLLMTYFSLAQDKNEKYQAKPGMKIDQIKEIQKIY